MSSDQWGWLRDFLRKIEDKVFVGAIVKDMIEKLTVATNEGRHLWHQVAPGMYRTYYPDEKYYLEVFPNEEAKLFVTDGILESLITRGNSVLEDLVGAVLKSAKDRDIDREFREVVLSRLANK